MKIINLFIISFLILVNNLSSQPVENLNEYPRNIILMIGDGMGLAHVYAAMTANHNKLNIERCPVIGFSKTYSADDYVTDSGAGATALSTGKKTRNGHIGVDPDGKPLTTILEFAEMNGLATGLVATSAITHATPASFIAHQKSRNDYEAIAADFLKVDIDVFIGGGLKYFTERKDDRNLVQELKSKDYQVVTSLEELEKIGKGKLVALLNESHMPSMKKGRGDMLSQSTLTALRILEQNSKGFFLMIEGSQIDWASHLNSDELLIKEVLDFDATVGKVLNFARKDQNTLVIILADHETGGVILKNGDFEKGTVKMKFSSKTHTGIMVPVYAFGKGASRFSGIYENTAVFQKMLEAFNFK